MRMEPGWFPYRRKPGKLRDFGGEARQLETKPDLGYIF